jgi:hypothetical protein
MVIFKKWLSAVECFIGWVAGFKELLLKCERV